MMNEKSERKPSRKTTPKNPELLTSKQKRFIDGKLAGKSSRKAALEAGYSAHTAAHANKDIAQKPAVDAAIQDWLLHAGVSTELLATRIRQGLDAGTRGCPNWHERRHYTELAL